MGDMADYYMERDFLFDLDNEGQHDSEPITSETEWRTKDGQRVRIRDMTDSHLLNTINVLRGKSRKGTTFKTDDVRRREWLNVMANEAYKRGLTLDEVDGKDPVHE